MTQRQIRNLMTLICELFLQSKNDSVTKIVLRHKGWLKNNSLNPWVKETNSFFISFSTQKVYIIENTRQSHRRSKHWQHWVTLHNNKWYIFSIFQKAYEMLIALVGEERGLNVTDWRQERQERVSGPVLLVWAQFSRSNVIVFIFTSSILSIWDIYTGNLGAILYKFSPCDNKIVITGDGGRGHRRSLTTSLLKYLSPE